MLRLCVVLLLLLPGVQPLTVTLKIAVDANNGVADASSSKSERFTCAESLDMVHRLRAKSDAVLVGKTTVAVDNPSLLVRRGINVEKQPLRIILDPQLSLFNDQEEEEEEETYQLFSGGYPTLVYHCCSKTVSHVHDSVACVYVEPDETNLRLPILSICRDLEESRNVQHLMVEGGPFTARAFLQAGVVNRCLLVRAQSVRFSDPVPLGIDNLNDYELRHLGTVPSGVDEIECWAKENDKWPTEKLEDWP